MRLDFPASYFALAAAILLMCLWALASSHEAPWQYAESAQRQTENMDAPASDTATGIPKQQPPNSSIEAAENKENRGPKPTQAWGTSDKIAVAAAFFALAQFIALVWTIVVMVRNGRRQLRAYVHYDTGVLHNLDEVTPVVQVRLKNFGLTPAYDLYVANVVRLADPATDVPDPVDTQYVSRGPLAPGHNCVLTLRLDNPTLDADQKGRIRGGGAALYFLAKLRYTDAFGQGRTTEVKLVYGGESGAHPHGNFATCEDGNSAT